MVGSTEVEVQGVQNSQRPVSVARATQQHPRASGDRRTSDHPDHPGGHHPGWRGRRVFGLGRGASSLSTPVRASIEQLGHQ